MFDELVWTAVHVVEVTLAESAGVSLDEATEVLGSDPDDRLTAVRERTDTLLATVDVPGVAGAVQAVRAARPDLAHALGAYTHIVTLVETPLQEVLDRLSFPDRAATSGSVPASAHVLALAVEVRTTLPQLVYGTFATTFDVRDAPSSELERLIDVRHGHDAAVQELLASTAAGPRVRSAVDWLRTDDAVADFVASLDAFIATSLEQGLPAQGRDLVLDEFAQRIDQFATMLAAMSGWADPGTALLDEAADGVLAAADDAGHEADREIFRADLVAALLTAATLFAAVVAGRFIVRPLRLLRRAAIDLQANRDPADDTPPGGPAEVREAAQAIEDAGARIDLVTRQARALASGDLDALVLDEDAPGGLGDALQDAVGVLRAALAQQEEFRRRLAHEAEHDGLTKVANRNASMAQLHRSLARTQRSGSRLALLFIDLDRFKDVNDHHGHQAGDVVLTSVAQRLVNSVREGDHVGRLGGDEFLVIAEPVTDVDDAVQLAHRVRDAVREPVLLATTEVGIGASIGVAIADGTQLTADELLRDSDLAVYRAKARGRGGVEVCDEDLRQELADIAELTAAIRDAVVRDELVLHYQAIVDAATQQVHAWEALVRWRRPGHAGLVLPAGFIGFAERSQLIIDIDRWVLDAAIGQLAAWQTAASPVLAPVAVNLSGRHLAHDDVVAHVLEPLSRHGVDPHRLIVEVTESALLDDLDIAAHKLDQLRDAGVLVAIDDFGTGYTSLAHLRSLPVDVLKIDSSFTAGVGTGTHEESILKLIIDTGHLLGATITAEGVETLGEAAELRRLGADHLQGYRFARPLPANELGEGRAGPPPA